MRIIYNSFCIFKFTIAQFCTSLFGISNFMHTSKLNCLTSFNWTFHFLWAAWKLC